MCAASAAAAAAAAGVLLMRLLPGNAQYREVPAALLRGWMLGKVRECCCCICA
jgi:hypothetical protein